RTTGTPDPQRAIVLFGLYDLSNELFGKCVELSFLAKEIRFVCRDQVKNDFQLRFAVGMVNEVVIILFKRIQFEFADSVGKAFLKNELCGFVVAKTAVLVDKVGKQAKGTVD